MADFVDPQRAPRSDGGGERAQQPRDADQAVAGGRPGMAGVRAERDASVAETTYRFSGGRAGTAPMARVEAQRQQSFGAIGRILRKESASRGAGGGAAPAIPRSGGSPLPSAVRADMEPKLGADLSGVRIHTGGDSHDAAAGYGARAFTVGNDVHFGAGQFSPETKEGRKLIRHELTHVVQGQSSGGVQRKAEEKKADGDGGEGAEAAHGPEVSDPNEPAEKEAEHEEEKEDKEDKGAKADGKSAKGPKKGDDKGDDKGDAKEAEPAKISAKLDGVGTKLYRAPAAGTASAPRSAPAAGTAPPAAGGAQQQQQQETAKVALPNGPVELAKPDFEQLPESVLGQFAAAAQELVQETVKLQETAMAYEKKYCSGGWRKTVWGLLKTPLPAPLNMAVVDGAVTAAMSSEGIILGAPKTKAGVQTAMSAMQLATQAQDAAIAEVHAFEARVGQSTSAFKANLKAKAVIGVGAAIVGAVVGVAIAGAAPLVGVGVAAAKVVGAVAAGAASGAASGAAGAQVAMNQAKANNQQVVDNRLSEAINQAIPGAIFGLVGGPLLVNKLLTLLPPNIVQNLGGKATEIVTKSVLSLIGIKPKGIIAEKLRGKPDEAPFQPEQVMSEYAATFDIQALLQEINKLQLEQGGGAQPGAGAGAPAGQPAGAGPRPGTHHADATAYLNSPNHDAMERGYNR